MIPMYKYTTAYQSFILILTFVCGISSGVLIVISVKKGIDILDKKDWSITKKIIVCILIIIPAVAFMPLYLELLTNYLL